MSWALLKKKIDFSSDTNAQQDIVVVVVVFVVVKSVLRVDHFFKTILQEGLIKFRPDP